MRLRGGQGGQGGQGALGGPAGPVSWFFPTPVQTLLSETQGVRRSAPSRVRRPSEAPGSVKEGARRGPAAGSRVTRPKKGETARWRPPLRAGAVSRGAATAGAEGAWALRRLKAPGSAAGSWLPGNPAHGAGQAVEQGPFSYSLRVCHPAHRRTESFSSDPSHPLRNPPTFGHGRCGCVWPCVRWGGAGARQLWPWIKRLHA